MHIDDALRYRYSIFANLHFRNNRDIIVCRSLLVSNYRLKCRLTDLVVFCSSCVFCSLSVLGTMRITPKTISYHFIDAIVCTIIY